MKLLIFLASILWSFYWGGSAYAFTATNTPPVGSCVNDTSIGTVAWSRPDRATASDNSRATLSLDGTTSNYILCTSYGFGLPADAIIGGITVNVERRSSRTDGGGSRDAAMRIVQGGVIGTTDNRTGASYTTSDVTEPHGGATDLWGLTWTAADINANSFGAAFAATKPSSSGNSHTVSVDYIGISVEYTRPQTITFNAQTTPRTYSFNGTFAINPFATASSGLAITYNTSTTPLVCSVTGTTVTILTAGICTITATQGGDTDWNAATPVSQSVTINPASQTITFGAQTTPRTYSVGGTFAINPVATTTSPLAITYNTSTTPLVCSVTGTTVTILTAGTCTITATQGGDTNWTAATPVSRSVTINPASQTITFTSTAPGSATVGGATYTPTATGGASGNTVTFTVDATASSVCSISGGVVSFTAAGSCVLDANQLGNTNYNAAAQVQQSFTVNSAPTAPTVITNAASPVSITGATLNGTVSSNRADTAVTFEYGLTAGYGSGPIAATPSPVLGSNSSPTAVSAAVTVLTCSTTYHFRAIGVNSVGTTNGLDGQFTTLACAAPTVVTNAASAPSISGATLNGTVSSNGADTAVTFDYWVTSGPVSSITATPNSVLGSNTSSTAVSAAVTGLICNTLYYFHAKGVNSIGTGTGVDGSVTTLTCPSLGNVINTYYPGGLNTSVAAGSTSMVLGAAAPTGATTPIAIGDTLIIMQMQDASINSANTDAYGDGTAGDKVGSGTTGVGGSGVYEYVIATSNVPISGGTLTLACGTANAYSNADATGSAGKKTYQVIRVPVYSNATLTASLTALAWNGSTGGVLAFDATGVLALGNATITVDVSGKGFRGGASRMLSGPGTGTGALNTDYRTLATVNSNGSKGEGIAGTPRYVFTAPSTRTDTTLEGYPSGSHGRGAPANAGGGGTDLSPVDNQQNPGGGGGANGGTGGIGGIAWCPGFSTTGPNYGCGLPALTNGTNPGGSTGGFGGAAVAGLGATRLTLGGGGGGGSTNNGTGTLGNGLNSSGAAGGGIIMLRAGSMSGTATFTANGSNGDSTVANDGTGGGGAGGAVLISAGSGMGGATINVKGGNGGTNLGPLEVPAGAKNTPHGPGGGGGGGYAITTGAPAVASSAVAGANGVTYNSNTSPAIFGAYGATSGNPGSFVTSLTAALIPGTKLGATSCIDHYELSVPSSSITCWPTTVTVTACKDGNNPCTPVAMIAAGSATLATVVSPPTSSPTIGTVTFPSSSPPSPPSVATTTLSDSGAADGTAVTVSINNVSANLAAQNVATCLGGVGGCTTTFNTAGFIFSSLVGGGIATIPTQVAGTSSGTYYLRAVKTSTTTQACESALVGQQTINFAYECNNPITCSSSNLMTVNGTVLGDGGWGAATAPTPIIRNNNSSVASYGPVNMTFDANGNAPFLFNYLDVGQVTLWASKAAGGLLLSTLTGSSTPFVVKPGGFVLSNIVRTSDSFVNSPPAADAAGTKFVKAGENFSVTVTATTTPASGALTTPNYGREISPESVGFVDTSLLHTDPNYPNHGTLVPTLGLTHNPPISGTFGAFSGGVAIANGVTFLPDGFTRSTPFTWNEVGIIELTPSVGDGDYLGTAASGPDPDHTPYGINGDTIGTRSNVGRFYAAKFALSGGSIANRTDITGCAAGCDTFTYMGEQMSALFTLTAKAVDGTTTLQNYNWSATAANQFAKLDPLAAVTPGTGGPLVLGAVDSAATRTPFPPCGVTQAHPCLTPAQATTGTFASGVATVTVPFTIYRDNAAAAGPYALLDVGVAPLDSDGAIMAAYDRDTVNVTAGTANHTWVGQTKARYGRLKMQNMYGSERLPLAVPLQAQYWSGSYFMNNADDSLTGVPPASQTLATGVLPVDVVGLYFYPITAKNSLSSGDVTPTPCTTTGAPSGALCGTVGVATSKLAVGQAKLQFLAPNYNHPGWLDIILWVPDYLKYNWGNCNGQTGTAGLNDDYPCARATFGTYKSPLIYRRENY